MAAEAIVRKLHKEPKLAFDTNLGGTVNILESIRPGFAEKTWAGWTATGE